MTDRPTNQPTSQPPTEPPPEPTPPRDHTGRMLEILNLRIVGLEGQLERRSESARALGKQMTEHLMQQNEQFMGEQRANLKDAMRRAIIAQHDISLMGIQTLTVGETEPVKERDSDGNSGFWATGVEAAWGLIANAWGGDWDMATDEWREAAGRWRDRYWNGGRNRFSGDEVDEVVSEARIPEIQEEGEPPMTTLQADEYHRVPQANAELGVQNVEFRAEIASLSERLGTREKMLTKHREDTQRDKETILKLKAALKTDNEKLDQAIAAIKAVQRDADVQIEKAAKAAQAENRWVEKTGMAQAEANRLNHEKDAQRNTIDGLLQGLQDRDAIIQGMMEPLFVFSESDNWQQIRKGSLWSHPGIEPIAFAIKTLTDARQAVSDLETPQGAQP